MASVLPTMSILTRPRGKTIHVRCSSCSCNCCRKTVIPRKPHIGRWIVKAAADAAPLPPEGNSQPNSNSDFKDFGTNSAVGNQNASSSLDTVALPENFCLIESRNSVKDFASLNPDELDKNIEGRRNKIFLLMEEVRRLRIQQKLKSPDSEEMFLERYPSALPFLPPLTDKTLRTYYSVYAAIVGVIILFGGILAPALEVRLGIGGTSYVDFIRGMHLPAQLAEVDPIVASFCGGAVGVLSALLVVEVNNATEQARRRCIYCEGMGYLTCGTCLGAGISGEGAGMCPYCSGTGKVMCTACLCTGKQMATEHDQRIDPFD